MSWFGWAQLVALGCLGCMAVGRGLLLAARGVRVLAIDRQRTAAEILWDVLSLICLGLGGYEVVAWALALPLPAALRSGWPGEVVVGSVAAKAAGAAMVAGGLTLYALALKALGKSWRLGIDRQTRGPLVTAGVYRWSRNPVYVALVIFAFGIFLLQGRLLSLALVGLLLPVVHQQVLREERFLLLRYGDAYREYSGRVARYVTLSRPARTSRPGCGDRGGNRPPQT